MRGKRSKQYRKLMEQFSMTFGFREPYQILVDAEMVRDACRFKMDLEASLSKTVHGKVKPMITQCEIRKLYASNKEPGVPEAIEMAKTLERRRCGHHPDEYPEPLPTLKCLQSVVDPKDSGQNKHRYVVASQAQDVRRMLRGVRGVPLIYIKRSVMILEPMADESVQARAREERSKFRAELKKMPGKRKRAEEEDEEETETKAQPTSEVAAKADEKKKKKSKKAYGPKGPNPLSVKKSKKAQPEKAHTNGDAKSEKGAATKDQDTTDKPKRKRRRKGKTGAAEGGGEGEGEGDNGAAVTAGGDES